jgi:protein ImuB
LHTTLARIQVAHACLDARTAQALHAMGLRRLGQLFAAPRASLAQRFGNRLLEHLDRLRGDAPDPFPLYRPPDRFDLRLELPYEIEHSQALLFPVRRMTADLGAFLAGRDGGVQRFVLRLEHEDHPDTEVVVGMLAAEREPSLLFDLARGRLEQARIPAPVRGLRLVAEELPPFVPAGRELFDERSSQAMPWTILRERLRARLGDDAVYALAPADDHRPERAWRRTPLPPGTKPEIEPAPRPTWLLQRPIPLRDSTLRILAGPERVESGWWDGGDVRRDYYVVETSSGQRAWTYRGVGETDTPFMLHGWFS